MVKGTIKIKKTVLTLAVLSAITSLGMTSPVWASMSPDNGYGTKVEYNGSNPTQTDFTGADGRIHKKWEDTSDGTKVTGKNSRFGLVAWEGDWHVINNHLSVTMEGDSLADGSSHYQGTIAVYAKDKGTLLEIGNQGISGQISKNLHTYGTMELNTNTMGSNFFLPQTGALRPLTKQM